MNESIKADICVIGGGSGGLSVAAGASQMGAKVVLIEKAKMGGDCLNYGCVPSKALLAAAHAAQHVRDAATFGTDATLHAIDAQKVHDYVHGIIAGIAPHDSVERFEGMGVQVIQGAARFIGSQTVIADGKTIQAKRFVIATGSRAFIPPIDGLDNIEYLTNETIFNLTQTPKHLIILGGGPIGIEMAQAQRQLGAEVTVLVRSAMMPKDDPELVDFVRARLRQDGVNIVEHTSVENITRLNDEIIVKTRDEIYTGSHLLVATGRQVNADGLDLEAANVAYDTHGIRVDARLRTTNKKIFAIGDVTGGLQFTHKAGYDAGIIIRNTLFRLPAKADYSTLPWVTYSNPELASVGLSEEAARKDHDDIRILRWPFSENDRARTENKTQGLIKVITTKKGRILGAAIVGPSAGELIQVWVLALSQKLKIGAIASMVAPYPTLGEVSKRAAGSFFTPSLFSEKTKKFVRFLLRFGQFRPMEKSRHINLGLSARLLILTAIFILLAEAFIYIPSIARYRKVYLLDHMEKAHLAVLSLEAAPDKMVNDDLRDLLLQHAEAYGIILIEGHKRMLVLSKEMPPKTDLNIDMADQSWIPMVLDAFDTLFQKENRILRIKGNSPRNPAVSIEVILDEAPLQVEMADYSQRILNLSLVISLITGILVYISLHGLLVRPIRKLARNMADFRESPEDENTIIIPSHRRDEIGQTEAELHAMQGELRKLLRQKDRLASIGSAVAKINHDLRNSLSKTMLISDQIAGSTDEKVQKLAPQLCQSVDQAIDLCAQTMDYVANATPRLDKELFYLHDLVDEVIAHVEDLHDQTTQVENHVDELAEAEGDITQLRRVLVNLVRNALQMGATCVTITNDKCTVDVIDNGPGLPNKAQTNLFKPFSVSTRRGGTGLGLVIARDIMRAHGGDLNLQQTSEQGTTFRLSLPELEDM